MEALKNKKLKQIKDNFFKNGFVVLKKFYTKKEIFKVLNCVSNIISIAMRENKIKFKIKHTSDLQHELDKKYLFIKNKKPKLKSDIYNQLKKLDKLNHLFSNNKILSVINYVLDSESIIDNIQIRIDDRSNDRNLDLHQELDQKSLKNITVWLPFKKLSKSKSGGIKIIPKSHKLRFIEHETKTTKNMKYLGISKKTLSEKKLKAKIIKINSGDLLLFHPLLIHGSAQNKSKNIRWTGIARYNSFNYLRLFMDGKENFTGEKKQYLYKKYYNTNNFKWI